MLPSQPAVTSDVRQTGSRAWRTIRSGEKPNRGRKCCIRRHGIPRDSTAWQWTQHLFLRSWYIITTMTFNDRPRYCKDALFFSFLRSPQWNFFTLTFGTQVKGIAPSVWFLFPSLLPLLFFLPTPNRRDGPNSTGKERGSKKLLKGTVLSQNRNRNLRYSGQWGEELFCQQPINNWVHRIPPVWVLIKIF